MSTSSLIGARRGVLFSAVTWLVLLSAALAAQAVQDGKWMVSSTAANHGLYVNHTGATQKVMVTVCTTSGGSVNMLVNSSAVAVIAASECSTRSESLTTTSSFGVQLTSGTTASGTYSVSVLP